LIRQAARFLSEALSKVDDQRQDDLLQDLFFFDALGAPEDGKRRRRRVPRPEPPPPRPRVFQVDKFESGFRVSTVPGSNLNAARIAFAYDRRDSNPFSHYDPNDFIATDLELATENCTHRVDGDNVIMMLRIDDAEGAQLTVAGFDENRDIIVKVRRFSDPSS
jgi:hypothetical protein